MRIRPNPPSTPTRSPGTTYPMGPQNGLVVGAWQQRRFAYRAPFSEDYDFTQRQFRRYVGTGAQDVQLPSGFYHKQWQGRKIPYRGTGYLWAAMPRSPGMTRKTYAGVYPKPPSMSQLQNVVSVTAGSQPKNPAGLGGPGGIAGDSYDNPFTG